MNPTSYHIVYLRPLEIIISDSETRYIIARYDTPPEYPVGAIVYIWGQSFMVVATHNDLLPIPTDYRGLTTEPRIPALGFRGLAANDCEVLLRLVSNRDAINLDDFSNSGIRIIKTDT